MIAYHERFNFMLHNDIDELKQLCQVDKLSQHICSCTEFWQYYFHEHKLRLPIRQYKSSYEWIKAFTVSQAVKEILMYLDLENSNNVNFFNINSNLFNRFIDKNIISDEIDINQIEKNTYRLSYYDGSIIYDLQSISHLMYNLLYNNVPCNINISYTEQTDNSTSIYSYF